MLHLRRLVWFIATRLMLICILGGMLVCGFYMCLDTANIYVILNDGLQKRAEVILTLIYTGAFGLFYCCLL